ncbi:MAG: hypothetical protein OEO19_09545 [Gammaproteobacteria bacterium]|nr:hypothetical protein [Gammaproteobacteria bacterium]MDH3450375.1 hypothetical protein [Gammaproteobacteria bacterium]
MTRRKLGLVSPAMILAFVSFFGLSQASLAATCPKQIEELRTALDGGCVSRKACDGLKHKLDNAEHKLEQGKDRHAERRLADFVSVVEIVAPDSHEAVLAIYHSESICVASGSTNDGGSSNDDTSSEGVPTTDPFEGQMF